MLETYFTEAEQAQVLGRLWELLKKQAGKFNGIDSTSMSVERAQNILESMLYTLEVAIGGGIERAALLQTDLTPLLEQGRQILMRRKKEARVEWNLICRELPRVKNVYFLSTMKNLGFFFEQYDIYYGAHEIPCNIDYWPLCPVSEPLKGVSYIEQYLHQIQMENDFLNAFDNRVVNCLHRHYVPDAAEALFNLCDPVLTNAIGLAMLAQEIMGLNISPAEQELLYQLLCDRPIDELHVLVEEAALSVCQRCGLTSSEEQDYFARAAAGLPARIFEAVKHQDLSHLFLSFS